MGKIDELKEILNTLRLWLSLLVGAIFIVGGGVISRYDKNLTDGLFWVGLCLIVVFGLIIAFISLKIAKITKQTKDLKK